MNLSRGSLAPLFSLYRLRVRPHQWQALAVFSSLTALSVSLGFFLKPQYEAEGKMVLKRVSPSSVVTQVGQEVDRLDALSNLGNPALTQVEMIQSTSLLKQVIQELNLRDSAGEPLFVSAFQKKLTVSAVNATDILKISFKDPNAMRAANVVNQLMADYLKATTQSNQTEIAKGAQFIQQQIPEAETNLRRAETNLRQFLQTHQLIALKDSVTAAETRRNDLQRQIGDLQAQTANTDAQIAALSQKLGMSSTQAIALASLSQAPEIQEALRNIQTAESQLVQQRNRLTDSHPSVIAAQNDLANYKTQLQQKSAKILSQQQAGTAVPDANALIGALKQDLTGELVRLDSTRQGQIKQSTDLSRTLSDYREQSSQLPSLIQQQNELERKVQTAQTSYLGLTQKLKDAQIAENQTQGNVRIAVSAVPPDRPAGLGKSLIIGAGIVLGLLAAAATVFLLESLGQIIRTVREIEYAFDLKILGTLPLSARSRNLLLYDTGTTYHIPEVAVRDKPGSPTSEAYRLLQGHLKTLKGQPRQRVMLITSVIPQEGTSTVCANLGAAIAQTQRRVLIIDANLSAPVQDEIWFISQIEGLSNLLIENISLWAVVQNVSPNLDVLPFGNAVSDGPISLDNAQMETLIEHFSNLYDLVILDTPALTVSADTALLGQLADSIVIVARPNHLDFGSVSAVLPIVEQWGERVLGVVVNGVPLEEATYTFSSELPVTGPALIPLPQRPGTQSSVPQSSISPSSSPQSLKAQSSKARSSKAQPQRKNQTLEMEASSKMDDSADSTFLFTPSVSDTTQNSSIQMPSDHQSWEQTDLRQMPARQLQQLVEELGQDLLKATRLIREQEEELDLHSQTVSELQFQLQSAGEYHRHAANEYEKLGLEVQLADETERKRLLDQTLGGQRQRLRGQHETLRQALEILRTKQEEGFSASDLSSSLSGLASFVSALDKGRVRYPADE